MHAQGTKIMFWWCEDFVATIHLCSLFGFWVCDVEIACHIAISEVYDCAIELSLRCWRTR